MPRYRPWRFLRWLRASLAVAGYLVVVAGISELDIDGGLAPLWAVFAVPPFVYATLSFLVLRRVSLAQRLVWTGGACIVHLLLGTCAALLFSATDSLMPLAAFGIAFTHLAPTPILTLIATPFVMAPLRQRSLPGRTLTRAQRATRTTTPAPPIAPAPQSTPFAREARQREGSAPPVAAPAPGIEEAPPAKPVAPAAVSGHGSAPADDRMVRVPFERVASQLPAEAFVLPVERLGESLREPHYLLVPRRVVMQHLPDGAVEIDWAVVEPQFPALALGMSDIEFRQKYPDLKLSLPVAELLRQLPNDVLDLPAAPRVAGLEAFPPPFQPYAPDDPRVTARAATESAAAATAPPTPVPFDASELPTISPIGAPPPAPATPPAPIVSPLPASPLPAPPMTRPRLLMPPASVEPAPAAPPMPTQVVPAPSTAPVPSPAPVAVPPTPQRVGGTPLAQPTAVERTPPAPVREIVDRETLGRLAACLADVGSFDVWCGVADDVPLVAFTAPSLSREAATAIAARLAGLLGDAGGEQVTVRTVRAAVVVTAASTPLVVAVRRPNTAVAFAEMRAARAASLAGPRTGGGRTPARELSAVTVEPRVAGVAGTLSSFGAVEAAVLSHGSGGRVYVFREPGQEAERIASLALAAWDGFGRAAAELGPVVSIVFRQGRRRMLVRPVGAGSTLLAAAGPVARPGRAWRDAERAAVALEAR